MKFLALLFLVGFASASFRDVLDDAADEVLQDYVEAMELHPSLMTYMEFSEEVDEDDIKTEIGKKLKEHLNKILQKINDALERKEEIKQDLLDKFKEVREKLKDLHIDIGDKAKGLIDKLKEKVKDVWQHILDLLGGKEKRAINLRETFQKLKKAILEKIDKDALKQKIEQLFGKGSEFADQLLEIIKKKGEKGKEWLLDLIDRTFPDHETEKRSISEIWEKIKNHFKELHIELKEKYLKFGEWVKEVASKHLEKGKSKLENMKQIAREMIDHAKDISKDIAAEGVEFLRPYKEDFGSLWDDLKNKMKEVFNKSDD